MQDFNKIIEETITKTVTELKRAGLVKDNKQTPFQKTEQLLYNYMNFKRAIEDRLEQIEEIKHYGALQHSKSIISFSSNLNVNLDSEYEKMEDKIRAIESSIIVTKRFINIVESALEKINQDPYYDIIRLKYFEEKSREEIADILYVDVSTVTRNKNRLVDLIKVNLFSDEVIMELFH